MAKTQSALKTNGNEPANQNAPVSLDAFVAELYDDVKRFKEAYLAKHQANPEHYPLVIGPENAGAWFENFMFFCQDGTV